MSDDELPATRPEVTRIEFRMVVDGKPVVAVFSRPEKIAALLVDPQSLGEWLRALRDSPEVPELFRN